MMRIFKLLIMAANTPFYLAKIKKEISITIKKNSSDAIIITAVMSIVKTRMEISVIVITIMDNKSSENDDIDAMVD